MKVIKYLKQNGWRRVLQVLYRYKIDSLLIKVLGPVLKNKPLKNIIVIESHNDFDSNGGAFYDYLIRNHFQEKYKIVWLLKHNLDKRLPENVVAVPLYKPSIRKAYYKWRAKYFTADNDCSGKLRNNQISVYFGHGGFSLKNVKGHLNLPRTVDYILMYSHGVSDILADRFMLPKDDSRFKYIGIPYVDNFYNGVEGDLRKITSYRYNKVLLWMPTFRKGGGYQREDAMSNGKLGIPLIPNLDEYKNLNIFLAQRNLYLIIKLHPMQDLSDLLISDLSNIRVLDGNAVKKINVDNYRLMKDCDALISDYSSAAYDFLHTNKPIAYDFSDLDSYKVGLCTDKPEDFMAGPCIKDLSGLYNFIESVSDGKDEYFDERVKLRDVVFDFSDGDNSKRVVELLDLELK